MQVDELLSVPEAAALLRIPQATLRYWRHVGSGPRSFKVGPKRVMYRRADVEAWLQQQYDASDPNPAA